MRRLPLLAIPALFAGCSISLNFDADGTMNFAIGDIGSDCTIDQEPPKGCTITTDSSTGACVITAVCEGLEIVDTEQIQQEIADATNNNDRITTRIEGLELVANALRIEGFGDLPEGTTATATATTSGGNTALDLTESAYESLIGGTSVTVLQEPEAGQAWQDSAFLTELNDALDNSTPLLLTGELVVTIPDVSAFQGASGARGSLDWTAIVDGRGGVSLRAK